MEEKKVIISNGKEVTVKEIKFKDTFSTETKEKIDKFGYAPAMILLSCEFTEEDIDNLSKKDGTLLWKAYQDLNEEDVFQEPQQEKGD